MTVRVDTEALHRRAAQRAQREGTGVDALVVVRGRGDAECVELARAATDRLGGPEIWTVYPTNGGALVWAERLQDWPRHFAALGDALNEVTGADVEITVPPRPVGDPTRSLVPTPTAFLAHTVDPPLSKGPFNEWGVPEFRWGVPSGPTQALLSRAGDWACDGADAEVLGIVPVPTNAATAPTLLSQAIAESRQHTGIVATTAEGTPFRSLTVEHFGQSSWSDADDSTSPTARAEVLLGLAADMAASLDVAVVHPAVPGVTTWPTVARALWSSNRHLWSSFVPDAFGAAVLTGAHLARANDLSEWHVEPVAADRYLVRARDLEPWFRVGEGFHPMVFPGDPVRSRARADFGDMVLTREATQSLPRPGSAP